MKKKIFAIQKKLKKVSNEHEFKSFIAETPLFMLYTSGSTGAPKALVHTAGGYLVYASMTHKLVFDYNDSDVYWCIADIGWITGHTSVIFEGVPTYPDASRL